MTTLSYKAAHNQNLTIQHLKYENDLLLKRNQTLSLENAKLLQELNDCINKMQSLQVANIGNMLKEQREIIQIAKQESSTLFYGLDKKMRKSIGGLISSYQQNLSSQKCSLYGIYKSLAEIIGKLLRQKIEEKQNRLKQYLNDTEQRLIMRKTGRDKTSQVVHLIKQPPNEMNKQYRHMVQQMRFQTDLYHRIIRKVKRQTINVHTLQPIYHQIQELTETRWKLKMQQNKLIILQRQFQLGTFCPLDQQTSSALILQLGSHLKTIKAQMQSKIQSLA